MHQDRRIPFETGWWSFDLGEYRPCDGTYCLYAYETLPPLPEPDPSFYWLPTAVETVGRNASSRQYAAVLARKLDHLAEQATRCGVALPDAFVRFMLLETRIDSCTGCWFWPGDELVPCPSFAGAYLVGFLRDQQDCLVWSLLLMPSGEHCVVAVSGDCVTALPERQADALLGNLDLGGDDLADPASAGEDGATDVDTGVFLDGITVCAPTFSAFVHRFWLENTLWFKLDGTDATPPTTEELRYLEHYARQQHSGGQPSAT